MRFDHATAVVPDADAAAAALSRLLGAEPVAVVTIPGMAIRSFRVGDAEIHVNAPTGPGPVDEHLRRRGAGYHHLALRVDDLDAATRDLRQRGFRLLGAAVETAPGLREVFVDPDTAGGILIQLVERSAALEGRYAVDGGAVARLADQAAPEAVASCEHHKAVVRRLFSDVISTGDLSFVDRLVAADFVRHGGPPGAPQGIEGFRVGLSALRAAFPDWTSVVDDMVAEGDRVAARWTMGGTHRATFLGIPATGRTVTMREAGIFRFAGGKLAELWGVADEVALLRQLGVLPAE